MPAGLLLSAIVLLNCLNSTTEHDILSTWVDTISVEVTWCFTGPVNQYGCIRATISVQIEIIIYTPFISVV